jgi:hypothetical protein
MFVREAHEKVGLPACQQLRGGDPQRTLEASIAARDRAIERSHRLLDRPRRAQHLLTRGGQLDPLGSVIEQPHPQFVL